MLFRRLSLIAAAVALLLTSASGASAQSTYPLQDNGQESPVVVAGLTRDADPVAVARAAPLARTGTDVWVLVQVGFALLAVGAALSLAVRRNRSATTAKL